MIDSEFKRKVKDFVQKNKEDIVADIKDIVSINSVQGTPETDAPYGRGPKKALEKILEISKKNGLSVKNLDNRTGYAQIDGKSEKYLASIAHVDVVPRGNGWKADPFTVREINGYLVGRGVSDDKGPAVLTSYMMKFFKEQNLDLPYTMRAIFGSDEETGSSDVRCYLQQEKTPVFIFTPDADFPVCCGEKGIASFGLASKKIENGNVVKFKAGVASNVISDLARAKFKKSAGNFPEKENFEIADNGDTVTVTAHGIGGHAMRPQGKVSAIGMIMDYGLENNLFTADEKPYVEIIRDMHRNYDGSTLGIDAKDDVFDPLTVIGGLIDFEDGVFTQNINIRFPTSTSVEKMEKQLCEKLSSVGGRITSASGNPPFCSGPEHPAIQALLGVYNELTGKDEKPYTIGGGTYRRAFPAGAAFGIVSRNVPNPDYIGTEHMAEEGFSIDGLMDALEILICGMYELQKLEF